MLNFPPLTWAQGPETFSKLTVAPELADALTVNVPSGLYVGVGSVPQEMLPAAWSMTSVPLWLPW